MWKDPLKKEWEKNPLTVMVVVALTANAASRLLNAWSASKGRRAYAKQVDYRVNK